MIATRTELPILLLSQFHRRLSAFFAVQAGGGSFARRPRLGLTLVVSGDSRFDQVEAAWEAHPEPSRLGDSVPLPTEGR